MERSWPRRLLGLLVLCSAIAAQAGGSGLNVMVVVNGSSSNSLALGNYYCERRHIPAQNVLRINWVGSNIEWPRADFTASLQEPLRAALEARQLTHQIKYVALSMDIPYRVRDTTGANSTTSALFYGFKSDTKNDSCSLPVGTLNTYAGSESSYGLPTNSDVGYGSFLVTMLTAASIEDAKLTIDQGVLSDQSMPALPVFLAKSDDRLRNVRYASFDDAVFNSRLQGIRSVLLTNANSPSDLGAMAGYQNGVGQYVASGASFAPGAMADDLTSFAGMLFESTGQTPLLALLKAGAAGSYGTVVEPCAYLEKFPSPQNYFYQARGFALAECYYQSVANPHQGLLVGEPLAAPFAVPGAGSWLGLPDNAVLSGTTNLAVRFESGDPSRPLQALDLFVDGVWHSTLMNVAPGLKDSIIVSLNGQDIVSTAEPNATVASMASGLAQKINANSGSTQVEAVPHGDRIELRSTDISTAGSALALSARTAGGLASPTTYVRCSGDHFLDTEAYGCRSYVITNQPGPGDFLKLTVTKTNGQVVTLAVTNEPPVTNLAGLAKKLLHAVNTSSALSGLHGLVAEDINMHEDYPFNVYIYGTNDHSGEFNLRTRSPGWPAAQVTVALSGSRALKIMPSDNLRLDANRADLQPRAHLYVAAGLPVLTTNFAFNTSVLPDGYHELTAVAYEGTHVRTQTRISQRVQIMNTSFSGSLTLQGATTNIAIGQPFLFSVKANAVGLAKAELFSTGGMVGSLSGQASGTIPVPSPDLGLGIHPFYALLTGTDGKRYRTDTLWARIVPALAVEPPLLYSSEAGILSWRAVPGRTYNVLATSSLQQPFQAVGSITSTNSSVVWEEPSAGTGQRFYRVEALQ